MKNNKRNRTWIMKMTKFNDAVGGLIRRAWVPVILPVIGSAHLVGGAVMLGFPLDVAMGYMTVIFGVVIFGRWLYLILTDPDIVGVRLERPAPPTVKPPRYRGYQPDPVEVDGWKSPPTPPNKPSAVHRNPKINQPIPRQPNENP